MHAIELTEHYWECNDGCCSYTWYTVNVDGIEVTERFVNEYGTESTIRFDMQTAVAAALRHLGVDFPSDVDVVSWAQSLPTITLTSRTA